jgi:PAS domain S-box-containing protein
MAKRWECKVCGYIHVGEQPPEHCPVCGAERSQFLLLGGAKNGLLQDMFATFKLHPMAAHFPNGLVPTAVLFLLVYSVIGHACLETATFWLVMVATAAVPVSLGSGLHDWKNHFSARRAPIFFKKIGLAVTLLALGLAAIALSYGHPGLLASADWKYWLFLSCVAGMLGCVTLLGHYGGILASQVPGGVHDVNTPGSSDTSDSWSRHIVTRASEAILAADATGTIRLWNRGAERIFGVTAADAIGKSLNLIIPENLRERHWQGWAMVMQSGESRYGEDMLRVPAIRGDGSRFSAEFSIVMLKNNAGQVAGVAAILRDVSAQREREKRLQEQLADCRKE